MYWDNVFSYSWLLMFLAIIFGAVFGSFSTFLGYRLFNNKLKLTGIRSVCSKCEHKLSVFDLIPVLSFLLLRGKCRYCGSRIPIWYILGEIAMIVSFILAIKHFDGVNIKSFLMCLICFCLITQSIIDYRVMMSSDVLHIIELFACFLLAHLSGTKINYIMISYLIVALIFFVIAYVMKKIIKKDCIGFGDIKLFIILSPLVPFEKMPFFFALCGLFGIIFYFSKVFCPQQRNLSFASKLELLTYYKHQQFPFIPAIFFAFLLAFYF